MEKEYEMPAGAGESEFTDRKSVFLGHVMPVKSEEEALEKPKTATALQPEQELQ